MSHVKPLVSDEGDANVSHVEPLASDEGDANVSHVKPLVSDKESFILYDSKIALQG